MNETLGIKNKIPAIYFIFKITKTILIISFIALLVSTTGGPTKAALISLVVIYGIPYLIYVYIKISNISYVFEEGKLIIYLGILTKRSVTISYSMIQNVETKSGLLARVFNLTKINIWTSSPSQIIVTRGESYNHPDISIFIKSDDAEKMRNIIYKK